MLSGGGHFPRPPFAVGVPVGCHSLGDAQFASLDGPSGVDEAIKASRRERACSNPNLLSTLCQQTVQTQTPKEAAKPSEMDSSQLREILTAAPTDPVQIDPDEFRQPATLSRRKQVQLATLDPLISPLTPLVLSRRLR